MTKYEYQQRGQGLPYWVHYWIFDLLLDFIIIWMMKQYNIFGGVDDLNEENERDIDPIKKRMDDIHDCFMTVYILDMSYTFCQFMKDFKEKFNFKI